VSPMIRVRFAPSPTGYIHIGNTRIALFNWLFAMQHAGQFVLRYDDTDTERSKSEYVEGICQDLAWLGIKPDEVFFQSKRFNRYDQVIEQLKASGHLYACYETPEELELRRKIRLSRRLPPVYDREALRLSAAKKEAYAAEGRKPHWRFLLPNFVDNPFETQRSEVHWDDAVRGRQTVDLASISDPVLIRADGTYLYTLPSVVDDIDMAVSHIIRGDDHITNTGVQIAIFAALGAAVPVFGHINLLTTLSGEGLSKRKGDLSVRSLRQTGFEPMAIATLAVLIGTSESVEPCMSMQELTKHFDLASVSRSAAKFDPAELVSLNRHIVHGLTFAEVADRLAAMAIKGDKAAPFWLAVRDNLDTLADAGDWWKIVTDQTLHYEPLSNADRDFLQAALGFLPAEPWGRETWQQWTERLKDETDRRGKSLFKPLRRALTGRESGPELAELLPLLGLHLVTERLRSR